MGAEREAHGDVIFHHVFSGGHFRQAGRVLDDALAALLRQLGALAQGVDGPGPNAELAALLGAEVVYQVLDSTDGPSRPVSAMITR